MTGHDVTVQIDESLLLGGERCCTTIRFLDNKVETETEKRGLP